MFYKPSVVLFFFFCYLVSRSEMFKALTAVYFLDVGEIYIYKKRNPGIEFIHIGNVISLISIG